MASNPDLIFTGVSKNATSAVFDGYSQTPVEVQVSVTGGTLTAGTIKSQTSLDNVSWDNSSWVYSFAYGDINSNDAQSHPEGFPFIKFTLASLAFTYGQTQTVGTGLSDLTLAGTYTADTSHYYDIVITTAGVPDKFKWSKDGGIQSSEISITGSAQNIVDGLTVQFGATTTHVLHDAWRVTPASINCNMILGTVEGDQTFYGDTGVKGDTGTHGDTGTASTVKGDTGTHGDTGTPGTAVAKGDTGTGAKGDTGIAGTTTISTVHSTDTGVAGTMKADSLYLYVCYQTNKWARIPIYTGGF